jgi:cell division protein FtsB
MPKQAQPSPAQPSPGKRAAGPSTSAAPSVPAAGTVASAAQAAALVAVARSTKLTGRAALLAVVICAIALSLAYPVREYIAQRQQIDQLLAQQQSLADQVQALSEQNVQLSQTWYVEQEARDELHMCFPQETCYEVVSGQTTKSAAVKPQAAADPWYAKLWESVQKADATGAK